LAWHGLLFIAALALMLLVVWWHQDVRLIAEMHGYISAARDLLAGKEFTGMPGYRSFLPPGLAFFYMGGMWLFGTQNLVMLRVLQAILGALTVNMTYALARQWLDEKGAVASGILFLLLPVNIFMPDFLLTETLFTFLCTLGFLIICTEPQKLWRWAVAGLLWGMASLVRAVLLYYPLFLLLTSLIIWRKMLPWKGILLSLVLTAAVVSPWTIRNYSVHGVFMPVESKSGLDFYLYNHGTVRDLITNYSDEDEERQVYATASTEAGRNSAFIRAAVDWIVNHPHLYGFAMVRHLANWVGLERDVPQHMRYNYFGPQPTWFIMLISLIVVLPSAILMLLVVPGMLLPARNPKSEYPALMFILYMTLIAIVAYGFSRQRFPLMPFLMIFSVRALFSFRQSMPWSFHGWARVAVWSWWIFLFAAWALEMVIDFAPVLNFFTTGKPLE
jgi:4-amino-4-deoxy-L-arabinose transferase-like glycosyltransferase